MENKLKVWIVREEDGELYLYFTSRLIKVLTEWRPLDFDKEDGIGAKRIDSNLFPSVKWEDDEPTEAYIALAEPQSEKEQSQSKQEHKIDWEQRRYEIAKDILSAQHGNYPLTVEEGTDFAVEVADMLIQKLKEKSK